MPNIIDSIQISSSTFDVRDKSATTVVNLTQEQYDNLPSSAKTANVLYNITDATAGDLSQYWTSAQTQSAITEATSGKADTSYVDQSVSGKVDITTFNTYSGNVETSLSGKQDTLSAGTGIDITDNVISATGGGGKAIEAGRGISVTTGETADTVSFNLPISAGTGVNSLIIAGARTATGQKSIAIGTNSAAYGTQSIAINQSTANGQDSFSQGTSYAQKTRSSAFGQQNYSNNDAELSCGRYNNSVSASTTFGDSGNTLFSVGNGTSNSARHNAFEIRQNGDIYLTKDGQDVKLQDHLGSGGGGGGLTEDDELLLATALTDLNDRKADKSEVKDYLEEYQKKGDYVTTSTLNTRLADYETALDEQNVEEVTAYALNDLNNRFGGLKIVKITESEYAALATKDENTLYIVVADPS